MEIQQSPLISCRTVISGIFVLIALYLTSLYHYTLFHSLAEIFGIIVAYGVFMVAYNSRKFLDSNYLLYLGISYFFIGFVDLLHTFGYKGMGMFQEYGTNLSTQLWIIARYMESISYVIAAGFIRKKLNVKLVFLCYLVITTLLLMFIFLWQVFPVCFVEGQGLTMFKKISEYIISIILVSAVIYLLTVSPAVQAQETDLKGKIPKSALCYFGAVAKEDGKALVACFQPDAFIIDVSRKISGAQAIRRWAENEVMGGHYEILDIAAQSKNNLKLLIRFTPPGWKTGFKAHYKFELKDEKIANMDLQYA